MTSWGVPSTGKRALQATGTAGAFQHARRTRLMQTAGTTPQSTRYHHLTFMQTGVGNKENAASTAKAAKTPARGGSRAASDTHAGPSATAQPRRTGGEFPSKAQRVEAPAPRTVPPTNRSAMKQQRPVLAVTRRDGAQQQSLACTSAVSEAKSVLGGVHLHATQMRIYDIKLVGECHSHMCF